MPVGCLACFPSFGQYQPLPQRISLRRAGDGDGFFKISRDPLRARMGVSGDGSRDRPRRPEFSLFGVVVTDRWTLRRSAAAVVGDRCFSRRSPPPACCWAFRSSNYWPPALIALAIAGIQFLRPITLCSLSSVIDRFIIAHLVGPAADNSRKRRYRPAGADHSGDPSAIRPVSPLAVESPTRDASFVQSISKNGFEFLLAIIAASVVGLCRRVEQNPAMSFSTFRSMAAHHADVSIAVIFQVMTYQYLHIGFLLSGRSSSILWNTSLVLAGQSDRQLCPD